MNTLTIKPTHDYIATAACGCVVGMMAIIPGHEKELAKEIAGFVRDGCTIELVARDDEKFFNACDDFGHHCYPAQMVMTI